MAKLPSELPAAEIGSRMSSWDMFLCQKWKELSNDLAHFEYSLDVDKDLTKTNWNLRNHAKHFSTRASPSTQALISLPYNIYWYGFTPVLCGLHCINTIGSHSMQLNDPFPHAWHNKWQTILSHMQDSDNSIHRFVNVYTEVNTYFCIIQSC